MTPEEFAKLMQARQDKALATKAAQAHKPSLSAQRVAATKSSQTSARLIITASLPDFLDVQSVAALWDSSQGDVLRVSPTEIALSAPVNNKMLAQMERVLTAVFVQAARKGAAHFEIHGQWERMPTKTGSFTQAQVLDEDFDTLA